MMLEGKLQTERQVTFVLLRGAAGTDQAWDEALAELCAERMVFGSACLLRTSMTADGLRDHLSRKFPQAGKILVVQAGEEAAWSGLNPIDADWLLERL